jgi:hypothetical protein
MVLTTFVAVIYSIITGKMEKNRQPHAADKYFTKMNSFIAIAGIVIAIVCALVLLRDINHSPYEYGHSGLTQRANTAIVHSLTAATNASLHAVVSALK